MLPEKEFKKWLQQPENNKNIQKTAADIQKRLTMAHLRLPGTEHEFDSRNAHEVICQELYLFLMETPKIQDMLIQDPAAAKGTVIKHFLNHARDIIRSSQYSRDVYKDNWRSFRRHVMAVLRESEDFIKFPAHKDVAFGTSEPARAIFIPPEKTAEIPYPPDVPADFEQMNHKKHILKLAAHFLNHCSQIAGLGTVRMNLNDFISWIGCYVPIQMTPETPVEDDSPVSRISVPAPDHEKKACIRTWANNFFNRLNRKQKQIFYYYFCAGYTGRQVAERMGKKSHLSYQRDLLLEELKQFLAPLDGLSPAPEKGNAPADPEAFEFFMTELCAVLGRTVEKDT